MCFDSDAEIIAGTSLGGVKLLDHVTTYWDALDSTYTTVPTVTPTYRLDGYHTAVYTLVNHAIELHVHILTGLIYKLVALPGYGGKFQKVHLVWACPFYQIPRFKTFDINFDDVESRLFTSPAPPAFLFEPDLENSWPEDSPVLGVGCITIYDEDYIDHSNEYGIEYALNHRPR